MSSCFYFNIYLLEKLLLLQVEKLNFTEAHYVEFPY
jgi:hypothetical protein